MWRIDGDKPLRLAAAKLPTEATLEAYLEQDPSLLGERLLVIGRQLKTPHGKFIDLLAMDIEGNLHVLELKRDKTPRDVVAQVLDYGSWVTNLQRDQVIDIANDHLGEAPFEAAFEECFGTSVPDELNADLKLVVVATDLDESSERIVRYLSGTFGVPINVVFFAYLEDEGRRYLARTWLVSEELEGEATSYGNKKKGKRAEWNGRDWFVSFGDAGGGRSWKDARRYGFVSAGGGAWYSRTLRDLPEGARINVCIPGAGYVAIGETIGPAQRFDRAHVTVDGVEVPLATQPLTGIYTHGGPSEPQSDDRAEWVVPARWFEAVPAEQAYWEKGMFANQNSACKLRQEFTLERLAQHFHVADHL